MLIVPETCYILVDRYLVPGEDEESCIKQLEGVARELGLGDKSEIRLRPRNSPYMKSFSMEEDHPLVTTLQEQFKEVTGNDLPVDYDPSVCDSNILAVELDIPTVTFGSSGGGMHAANEYGYAWQVKNCAEIYKRTVIEMLK